jgi:hypothetical protein
MEEGVMSEFGRREAFLCGLVGLVIGVLIGSNFVYPSGIDVARPGGWGWGHWGFAPFFGIFWVFFWLLLISGLFWGGRWGRRGRYYHGRIEDLPADFDDWHRRAHERMKEAPAADDPGRRG